MALRPLNVGFAKTPELTTVVDVDVFLRDLEEFERLTFGTKNKRRKDEDCLRVIYDSLMERVRHVDSDYINRVMKAYIGT